MAKFSIRDLFWAIALAAVLLAWGQTSVYYKKELAGSSYEHVQKLKGQLAAEQRMLRKKRMTSRMKCKNCGNWFRA